MTGAHDPESIRPPRIKTVGRRSPLVKSSRWAEPVFNCCRQRELRFLFETTAQTAFKNVQKKGAAKDEFFQCTGNCKIVAHEQYITTIALITV